MTASVRCFDDEIAAILAKAKANGIRKPFVVEFQPVASLDWMSFAASEVPAPRTYEEAEAFALDNMGSGRARISIRTTKISAVTVAEFFPD